MRNIANVFIFALLISLGVSVAQNYTLLKDISSMHAYMQYATSHIKDKNDLKQKYNWNRSRLLKNTVFEYQTRPEFFTEDGVLADPYFKKINDALSSSHRFALEKKRRSILNKLTPLSTNDGFSHKYIHPRLGFNDELYIGFNEAILDNCKYEIFINGRKKKPTSTGIYECRKAPKVLIDIQKIFINPANQSLDTICVSKMISRA